MDFYLGSSVYNTDGEELGQLQRVLVHPVTREVTGLIVHRLGTEDRSVVVPIGTVNASEESTVEIALPAEGYDALDEYAVERNVAPPPYVEHDALPDDGSDHSITDVPPVGAASGIESIAFTPLIEETVSGHSDEVGLDRATAVWATDGAVGQVRGVWVQDDTRRVQGVYAEDGLLVAHQYAIEMAHVESLSSETVVLKIDKAPLAAPVE